MPVIVAPEAFDLWLDCAKVEAEAAAALIAPAPEALLEHYEVSPAVNRVANDFGGAYRAGIGGRGHGIARDGAAVDAGKAEAAGR